VQIHVFIISHRISHSYLHSIDSGEFKAACTFANDEIGNSSAGLTRETRGASSVPDSVSDTGHGEKPTQAHGTKGTVRGAHVIARGCAPATNGNGIFADKGESSIGHGAPRRRAGTSGGKRREDVTKTPEEGTQGEYD